MKNVLEVSPLGFPWQTQDPFLFTAYHRDEYPAGNAKMGIDFEHLRGRNVGQDFTLKDGWRMYHGTNMPGFPYHPHRGFETITINKEGFVDHTDSLGGAGRFGPGDVQWMTAGKGIQHSEMFPLLNQDKPNPAEIFQIWLNLPKASKFVEPHYKMLWQEDIPVVKIEDANGNTTEVDVIAGNFNDANAVNPTPNSWAANAENDVAVFTIKMEANATFTLPAAERKGTNRTLYFYKGATLQLDDATVNANHLIKVNPNIEIELKNGDTDGYLLLLQGKPIGEPVAQHGPFVMNTDAEIQEAFAEYRRTQFGGWPWPEQEQHHPKENGRFALHADGTEEVK